MNGTSRPPSAAALPILLSIGFVSLMGFGTVIPLLPFYGQVFDAPTWQITLMFAAFSFGQFFGELTWGRLSDRVGRRPVLLAVTVGASLTFFAFAFVPNLWLAVLLRAVSGFFTGHLSVIQGYVADISPKESLGRRLGLMGSVFGLSFVAGPVVGGLLAHPETGLAGLRPPIVLSAALYGLSALAVLGFLRESRRSAPGAPAAAGQLVVLRAALADPVIARLLTMTFLSFAAFSAVNTTVGLWGQHQFGWSPREVGLVFGLTGAVGSFGQWGYYRLFARRVGELPTIAVFLLVAAAFFAALALAPGPLSAVVLLTAGMTAHMVSQPASSTLISRLTPPDRQGSVLGANMAAAALSRVCAPVLAGAAISAAGFTAPFVLSALLLVPVLWLARTAARKRA